MEQSEKELVKEMKHLAFGMKHLLVLGACRFVEPKIAIVGTRKLLSKALFILVRAFEPAKPEPNPAPVEEKPEPVEEKKEESVIEQIANEGIPKEEGVQLVDQKYLPDNIKAKLVEDLGGRTLSYAEVPLKPPPPILQVSKPVVPSQEVYVQNELSGGEVVLPRTNVDGYPYYAKSAGELCKTWFDEYRLYLWYTKKISRRLQDGLEDYSDHFTKILRELKLHPIPANEYEVTQEMVENSKPFVRLAQGKINLSDHLKTFPVGRFSQLAVETVRQELSKRIEVMRGELAKMPVHARRDVKEHVRKNKKKEEVK